jgi:hypothetical protein
VTSATHSAQGSGIRGPSSSLSLSGVEVTGNFGGVEGGGVSVVFGASGSIEDSTIADNAATGDGGGLFVEEVGDLSVVRTLITGNTALEQGGGAYLAGIGARAFDSVVLADDFAGEAGGGLVVSEGCSNTLRQVTIVWNEASGEGGALAVTAAECSGSPVAVALTNAIVAWNEAGGSADEVWRSGSGDASVAGSASWPPLGGAFGVSFPGPAASQNGWTDPGFQTFSPALDLEQWDLHLGVSSSLSDVGTTTAGTNPGATTADVGAYGGPQSDDPAWYGWYADTDADALADGWEAAHLVDDPAGDEDGDGCLNDDEYVAGTSPRLADTDGDGSLDGADADPLDPSAG